MLVAELDRLGVWALCGALSCAAWLADLCAIEIGTTRTQRRVAQALVEFPALDAAMASGAISYAKACTLGAELRAVWTRILVRTRRARLLAYKVVAAQDAGEVDPADAAAYRIAVTTLDQESAEVLRAIIDEVPVGDERSERFCRAVEDH